jgi:hypothetical protein
MWPQKLRRGEANSTQAACLEMRPLPMGAEDTMINHRVKPE